MKKIGKILVKNAVKREPGKLYYVDGAGNVCSAVMSRGGRKKKAAKKKAPAKKRTPAKRKTTKKRR